MEKEIRKVQQVGYSTLIISLPKEWANQSGLKRGDTVSLIYEDDGSLRLYPGEKSWSDTSFKSIVDAEKCVESQMLTRIITGAYITGQDSIKISSKTRLSQEHINEIRTITKRLIGMSIVEQTFRSVILQNFVDPARFPINGLLRRLYVITSSMQELVLRALKENSRDLAIEAINMEEDVDSIYWLVVRQLLMAVRNRILTKAIGISSPLHIVGNRVVAKMLEKIGDYSENMAKEVLRAFDLQVSHDPKIVQQISEFFESIRNIYDLTMQAFFAGNMALANKAIELSKNAENEESKLTEGIFNEIKEAERKKINLDIASLMALRVIVWNLGQIVTHCSTIAEITINRALEEPTEICKWEKQ